MFQDFLEADYGVDNSPKDPTRITQIILYFDEPETEELKRLAKEAMKVEFPNDYIENGNLSMLYLKMLRRYYGKDNIEGVHVGQGVRIQTGPKTINEGFI